ncbi:MAG TPA: sialidase family protein, partial [Polyangia bacterium]
LGQETLSLEVINDTLKRDDGRLIFSIRDSCSVPRCQTLLVRNLPGVLPFTNTSKEAKSFIVQITARGPSQSRGFDLKASLILPPAEMFIGRNDILATSERGGSATFTVVLKSPPRSPTTIPLKSLTPGEAMVEPAALTFDAENWHRPQTVTIKGVDDDRRDGRQPFTISVEPAMSADPRYAGFDGEDVTGTNQDDEPNVAIDAPTILHTSESGATGTFRVALTQAPAAPVRIAVANNDATEATVTPTELSFDASNWQTAQTVTVTGVDDDERDGPALYQVRVGPTTTSDPRYQDLQTVAVTARNLDDEFAAIAAAPVAIPSSCWLTGRTDLAVDRGGTLYVVYACHKLDPSRNSRSDGTYVVTSHDGGRSYSSPLALTPDFEPQQIVGGAAGFAAVLVDNGGPQMRVLRTHDGGRTWESSHVANDRFPISLVWAGPRLTAVAVDGDETLHISTSVDAGKSWISHAHAGESGELRIDDDGTPWLFSRHGRLRRSTDGGATFDPGIALPYRTTPRIAWGRRRFFFLENGDTEQLRMATRSDPRTALTPTVVGRPRHSIPDIAITPDDGLVFLATVNGEAGHVVGHELRWIPSGSTTQGPPVVVPGGLGPVPLSDRAAALLNVHHEETHRIAVSVFLAP